MSILHELKKWIDGNAFREEQAQRERWQKLHVQSEPGAGTDTHLEVRRTSTRGVCRVCGTLAKDQAWCATCLAYTVVIDAST